MGCTRREFLKHTAAAAALTAAAGAPCVSQAAGRADKPHILLIMADQFRADCLAADGNQAIHTPNLDRIAAEGILFRRAYSSTPTCTPARAALLTGLSPWRHGMLGYGRVGERYSTEMPRLLRDAGYYTLGIGKMHWHPQRNTHGFHNTILDESGRAETPEFRSDYRAWFAAEAPHLDPDATGIGWNDYRGAQYALPEYLHPTWWTGATATRFLYNYNQPEPFFLKVSFTRPHSPYDPPRRFLRRYEDTALPPAAVGEWTTRFAERSGPDYTIWHGDLGEEQVRNSRQAYYGSVSFLDEQVGRILDALERRGWLEETLILFTADHGDMLGDHHLWRKSYAYESSARIPMAIRWPAGITAAQRGQVSWRPVELRDVLPTFLDVAGVSIPDQLDGASLLSLTGESPNWRPWIDLEHNICYSPDNHWNALTDGQVKYVFHARTGQEQLFDLRKDPMECRDLAADSAHAAELDLWRRRLVEHLHERGETFVKDAALVLRPEGCLYFPHYPGCACHPRE